MKKRTWICILLAVLAVAAAAAAFVYHRVFRAAEKEVEEEEGPAKDPAPVLRAEEPEDAAPAA